MLNKNINFNKKRMELKILQIASDRWTLCFSWYKNRKLKIKLLWVGACKRKKSKFLYRLFCPKETFLTTCFISIYSVLTTLLEYTYFYILKKHYFIYFLLAFKIVESLQCILKLNNQILIVFYNLKNYYSHLLMLELGKFLLK